MNTHNNEMENEKTFLGRKYCLNLWSEWFTLRKSAATATATDSNNIESDVFVHWIVIDSIRNNACVHINIDSLTVNEKLQPKRVTVSALGPLHNDRIKLDCFVVFIADI